MSFSSADAANSAGANGSLLGDRKDGSSLRRLTDGCWRALNWEPLATAAIVVGVLARIVFWALTQRQFEDALITITHARNAADGQGLTHHVQEPVTHGFTTALSVLIPLVGELLANAGLGLDGFGFMRFVSLLAFVASVIFAVQISRRLGVKRWALIFPLFYLALDQNQIFYGMSGMETQVAVALVLGGISGLMAQRAALTGIALGLAVLARPELAVLWVAPAVLWLLCWQWRKGLLAALCALVVAGPWFIFTFFYYGSFVPNTVEAKRLRYPTELPNFLDPLSIAGYLRKQVLDRHETWELFTPFLENGLIMKGALPFFVSANIAFMFLVLAAMGAWKGRAVFGWPAVLGFIGLFWVYRFVALPVGYYEWYYPPVLAVMAVMVGAGLSVMLSTARRTAIGVSLLLTSLFCIHVPITFELERRVQTDVEERVRVPLGRWLKANVPDNASVTSESAGYVGYYGERKLYDYPGLTSKQTLAVMKELGPDRNSLDNLIVAASPDYLVLRPSELQGITVARPEALSGYREVKRFKAPGPVQLSLAGVEYVNIDTEFVILRKN